MERGFIIRGVLLGTGAMLLIAATAALWVFCYSVVLAPGHDGAYYQAYGQRVAPTVAIVAGLPVLLAAGWASARGVRPLLAALIPALTYIGLDIAMSAAGDAWPSSWALLLSWLSKAIAAAVGGWFAQRQLAPRIVFQG